MRVRLRRLREPRYLLGAMSAPRTSTSRVCRAAARGRPARARRRGIPARHGVARPVRRPSAARRCSLLAGLAWILPATSTLFQFTEAETDVSVPRAGVAPAAADASPDAVAARSAVRGDGAGVPVRRRRDESISAGASRRIALWVTFVTIRVYFAGVTMARARLGSADLARAARGLGAARGSRSPPLAVVGVPLVACRCRRLPGCVVPRGDRASRGRVTTTGLPRRRLVAVPDAACVRCSRTGPPRTSRRCRVAPRAAGDDRVGR